ncbi:hypothetical protein BU26DRAFT_563038 [Trematosphaeria pertusa]|uniref:F-box domain-containing protein n=1 Tax=Trematosphaeria pertusa TaxID=390896 RepID=A0A6A6INE6_9PLEO|nr:uncharacterized protein BU26DRAFT_563038 [Trematosphaeria pertusa]KAF2251090.1 hypothetical protein BU26DRAFT_563038 [Trematosphaeria pertusa]
MSAPQSNENPQPNIRLESVGGCSSVLDNARSSTSKGSIPSPAETEEGPGRNKAIGRRVRRIRVGLKAVFKSSIKRRVTNKEARNAGARSATVREQSRKNKKRTLVQQVHRLKARLLFKSNSYFSGIYSLPVELVFLIMNYLGFVDLFCLAIASRRFYPIVTSVLSQLHPTQQEQDHLALRLETDWQYAHIRTLWCSNCKIDHGKFYFRRGQMLLTDSERVCFGVEGVFRLCQHKTFTFDELLNTIAGQPGIEKMRCWPCRAIVRQYSSPDQVRASFRGKLFPVKLEEAVTCDRVRRALQPLARLDKMMCPHLSIPGLELFERLVANAISEPANGGRADDHVFYPAFCKPAVAARCRYTGCDTSVWLLRDKRAVKMGIRRNLGAMKTVTDERWMAQLVSPQHRLIDGVEVDRGAEGEQKEAVPDPPGGILRGRAQERRFRWMLWAQDMRKREQTVEGCSGHSIFS